jgi:glycosyltransferase involved in cell wall biosynthesis
MKPLVPVSWRKYLGRRGVPRSAVLFMAEEHGGHTRYRCDHQAEQLRLLGASCDVAQFYDVNLAQAVERYECFVLHRLRWSDEVAILLDLAEKAGKTVIYDTDDLIFDPSHVHHFAFLDDEAEDARTSWARKLSRYRRTLQGSDGALVSTEPLAAGISDLNRHVEVAYNAVSIEMVNQADEALTRAGTRARQSPEGDVTIAYLSGTRTHNRDFLEAADAVLWALETYPRARLVVVGPLGLDSRFEQFGERIQRMPEQLWQDLPELLVDVDVNLAPLERDNPFTECKSCVKYAEAGLLGVPTVASRRGDFVRAIEHGRNAFLADTDSEWRDALRQLIESPELRRKMGASAREDVLRNHTTTAQARSLGQAFSALTQRDEDCKGRLVINWLAADGVQDTRGLPDLLSEAGHTVRMHTKEAKKLAPADVSIATDRSTAEIVAAHRQSLFKCRVISSIAEDANAYELPLRPICLDRALAERLEAMTGRPTEHLDDSAGTDGAVSARRFEELLHRTCFVRLNAP